ncbi:hypothetical protein FOZ60_012380 [Perkinsus olseni]|uniref:NPHP4 Ig-like domain-containing protein n=1 Tax=Perkinsus olseni TaxID=32597 RepID=A0A7J6PAG1_PEROL|nr:hypothetical protein FOZ60_012380 [Perkinsus olseni]
MIRCYSQPTAAGLCREASVKAVPSRVRMAKEALYNLDTRADSLTLAKLRDAGLDLRGDPRQLMVESGKGSRTPRELLFIDDDEEDLLGNFRTLHNNRDSIVPQQEKKPTIKNRYRLSKFNFGTINPSLEDEKRPKLFTSSAKELRKMQHLLLKPRSLRPRVLHGGATFIRHPTRDELGCSHSTMASRRASSQLTVVPRLPLHTLGDKADLWEPKPKAGGPRSTRASRLRAQSVEKTLQQYEDEEEADRLLLKRTAHWPVDPVSASTRPSTVGPCTSASFFDSTKTDWVGRNRKYSVESLLYGSHQHLKRLEYLSSHRLRAPQVCLSAPPTRAKGSEKGDNRPSTIALQWTPKGVEEALRKLFEELAEGHLVSRSIFTEALGDRGSHHHLVGSLFKHDEEETAAPSGVAALPDEDVIATQCLDDALCGIAPGSSPSINRTYNVTLRTGQELRKKISYLNATGLVQIYRLTSSQPSILRLLDDTLVLDPRTKGYIRLMILPLSREIRTRVIVSVTPSDMSVPHAIKEDLAFDLTYMAMP